MSVKFPEAVSLDLHAVESAVCAACLSYGAGVRTSPTLLFYMRMLLPGSQMPDSALGVCWQCAAAILAMRRFHELVQSSQLALQRFWHQCQTPSEETAKPVLLNVNRRLRISAVLLTDSLGEIITAAVSGSVPAAILKLNLEHPLHNSTLRYAIQLAGVDTGTQRNSVMRHSSVVHDSDQSDDETLSSIRLRRIKAENVDEPPSASDDVCVDPEIVKEKRLKKRKRTARFYSP